ncbi:MAG TPA: SMP-30/gluconolactonase/LRE family protein [Solirubrobacteraceae bacterium]|nr:SMP-30/gluconolactonase/LRE family protein [Solirubrobacteraceae bacterium]
MGKRAERIKSDVLGGLAARAVAPCGEPAQWRVLHSRCGLLESVIVHDGRLFFTSQTRRALLRLDAPDATPVEVATDVHAPGGLAVAGDGRLILGFGDSPRDGMAGNWSPRAGLLLVDPGGGGKEPWVQGLGMANGVARAPDGTVFASNDFGTHLDRVSPDGTVQRNWARVFSGNGLVVDAEGRYLYAAQTFTRAKIRRVEIAEPAKVTVHARPPLLAAASFLDGLAIDAAGRLYVAVNGAGQVWRVDPDGRICALARGLGSPSAVALGEPGTAFPDLYAVTFGGDVIAIT